MARQPKFNRTTYPPHVKKQAVSDLLAGKKTVAQVARENMVQPVQVYAWVGQETLKAFNEERVK